MLRLLNTSARFAVRGKALHRCIASGNVLDGELLKNADFEVNQKNMENVVNHFKQTYVKVLEGGGEKAIKKHKQRGKLLARERIDTLVDAGTPFLELSALA
eukprot:gene16896-19257_t